MTTDEGARARARRRALARQHHPDLGGDADLFAQAMHELDQANGSDLDRHEVEVRSSARSRWTRRITRPGRAAVGTLRRRLPRSMPGSRRYIHID